MSKSKRQYFIPTTSLEKSTFRILPATPIVFDHFSLMTRTIHTEHIEEVEKWMKKKSDIHRVLKLENSDYMQYLDEVNNYVNEK